MNDKYKITYEIHQRFVDDKYQWIKTFFIEKRKLFGWYKLYSTNGRMQNYFTFVDYETAETYLFNLYKKT